MQQLSPRIAAAEDSLARLEWAPDTADEDELEATRAHLRTAHGALVSTKRAKERFEKRDLSGSQKDLIERIALYDKSVTRSRSSN